MRTTQAPVRAFWEALGLNIVWMNASEVFRYFVIVKPRMARDFSEVPGIVPDNPLIGLLWVLWDGLLIAATMMVLWLVVDRYGATLRNALAGATLIWVSVFVLLWLGLHNMGLATRSTLAFALPLAWAELAVAAIILTWRIRAQASACLAL
jgi:hypothetical protein